ncbi:hypothetical protein D3C76_1447490 [compost metagenome]
MLFPKVTDDKIANRLGCFYEEAEKCLSNNAWLSYSLMCAAIFEGLLYWKYKTKESLYSLTENAYAENVIDLHTKLIIDNVRNSRNLVHTNNYNDDYISRCKAMDIRTTMDKLIKEFDYN